MHALSSRLALVLLMVVGSIVLGPPATRVGAAPLPPLTIYATIGSVGLFRATSINGPWQGPSSLPADVTSLAVGDSAHRRSVYATLHGHLYMSNDGGVAWTPGGPRGRQVTAVVADPHDPTAVVVGTDRGVYVSGDSGATWTAGDTISRTVVALTATPDYTHLYAASRTRIWSSSDGGLHWLAMKSASGIPSVVALTVASTAALTEAATLPPSVYALAAHGLWSMREGIWKVLDTRALGQRSITVIGGDPTHLFVAGGDNVLFISTDGGTTWSHVAITVLHGGITALATDIQRPGLLVVGDSGGTVAFSSDGGATWSGPVPAATVTGALGNPVITLALTERQPIPLAGVPDPQQSGVRWFSTNGGHTLRGAFLAYWQVHGGVEVVGTPLSEEFSDAEHAGMRAQYFDRMELLTDGVSVTPAPLAAESVGGIGVARHATVALDPHFAAFWAQNGGNDVLGPPLTAAVRQTNGDGTGQLYLVQYCRYARLEYHPELLNGGGTAVQVGLLGTQALRSGGWL